MQGLEPSEVAEKQTKKTQKYQKRSFSVISETFWCPRFFTPQNLFDNLAQQCAPPNSPKHN